VRVSGDGSEPNSPLKTCAVCAADMPAAARKCLACGSFQDRRLLRGLATTDLSLLVALVSVIAASAPALVPLLTKKDSELILGHPAFRGGEYVQFVSNGGGRPGAIDNARLLRDDQGSNQSGWIYLMDVSAADQKHVVLKPGESTLVSYTLDMDGEGRLDLPSPTTGSKCRMDTYSTSFRGKQLRSTAAVDCDEMYIAVVSADLRRRAIAAKPGQAAGAGSASADRRSGPK
jgi:hypothetical protein